MNILVHALLNRKKPYLSVTHELCRDTGSTFAPTHRTPITEFAAKLRLSLVLLWQHLQLLMARWEETRIHKIPIADPLGIIPHVTARHIPKNTDVNKCQLADAAPRKSHTTIEITLKPKP